MKILIAEDDMVSGMVLATQLKKQNHEVIRAADGREAWYAYLRERPRVVLTDWMMPQMDGLELTRKIRSEERLHYAYVIMITALAGKDNYIEGMNAGADDFVTKPVDPAGLHARLRVAERILSLQAEAHRLEGLLPVCMYCKNIRDAGDRWHSLEEYVGEKADLNFSHDLCPECRAVADEG